MNLLVQQLVITSGQRKRIHCTLFRNIKKTIINDKLRKRTFWGNCRTSPRFAIELNRDICEPPHAGTL